MPLLKEAIRRQLVVLARRSHARVTEFSLERPIDWRPGQVENPDGIVAKYFTDASAWEFIASQLENGLPVETVELNKPKGATGYVMKVSIQPDKPRVYIKLQLGAGKIIGRSFHYSERED